MELLGIFFLATFIEGFITYIVGESSENGYQPWIKYVALALGIVVAVAYEVNLPAMAGVTSSFLYVDFIVSGLIIGRGSNYLNDVISKIRE